MKKIFHLHSTLFKMVAMAVSMRKNLSLVAAFGAGVLYALCLPGNLVTLPFPAGIIGVAILLAAPTLVRFALFSLGYCCFAQYWVAHALHEFGGIAYFWSLLLTGLYSLVTLPQYLVFILLLKICHKRTLPLGPPSLSQKKRFVRFVADPRRIPLPPTVFPITWDTTGFKSPLGWDWPPSEAFPFSPLSVFGSPWG